MTSGSGDSRTPVVGWGGHPRMGAHRMVMPSPISFAPMTGDDTAMIGPLCWVSHCLRLPRICAAQSPAPQVDHRRGNAGARETAQHERGSDRRAVEPAAAVAIAAPTRHRQEQVLRVNHHRNAARPAALTGVKVSTAAIHWVSLALRRSRGRPRHCLTARAINPKPGENLQPALPGRRRTVVDEAERRPAKRSRSPP